MNPRNSHNRWAFPLKHGSAGVLLGLIVLANLSGYSDMSACPRYVTQRRGSGCLFATDYANSPFKVSINIKFSVM